MELNKSGKGYFDGICRENSCALFLRQKYENLISPLFKTYNFLNLNKFERFENY